MASRNDLPAEVLALVAQTRKLTGEAFVLSQSIDETVEELREFTHDVRQGQKQFEERRTQNLPWTGGERRA